MRAPHRSRPPAMRSPHVVLPTAVHQAERHLIISPAPASLMPQLAVPLTHLVRTAAPRVAFRATEGETSMLQNLVRSTTALAIGIVLLAASAAAVQAVPKDIAPGS